MKQGTSVDDYYGSNVQSSHDLPAPSTKVFNIKIDYDIAHSVCAVLEKAPWAKPLPADGTSSMSIGADGSEEEYDELSEINEVVEFHGEEGGGLTGGGGGGLTGGGGGELTGGGGLMENFE